jgi:hypothetical protein
METKVKRPVRQPKAPQPEQLIGVKDMFKDMEKWWQKSFFPIVFLTIGLFSGILYYKANVTNDCLTMGQFRSGDIAFQCIRK